MDSNGVNWKTDMEIASSDSFSKYSLMKSFTNSAREFLATHSELSLNSMKRTLGLLTTTKDISIFAPNRIESCSFYNSLWSVMNERDGPHWSGVLVLQTALKLPNVGHILINTYRFLPILAKLMTNELSFEEKSNLLQVLQDISYGVKIGWQDAYIQDTVRLLIDWIVMSLDDKIDGIVAHRSLIVLINICYGNPVVVNQLMRIVNVKEFIGKVVSNKDNLPGVSVSRLLLCLGEVRDTSHLHACIVWTMNSFTNSILERDSIDLIQCVSFMQDVANDSQFKALLATFDDFGPIVKTAVKNGVDIISVDEENADCDKTEILRNILKFLTIIVQLELFSLREYHEDILHLCIKSSLTALTDSLDLFTAVAMQYKDDDRLSPSLVGVLLEGLPTLLVPPEPGEMGSHWLFLVSSLCYYAELQQVLDTHVTKQRFEDVLYGYLEYAGQVSSFSSETIQNTVIEACLITLCRSNSCRSWESVTNRMVANRQVKMSLRLCLNSGRSKKVLHLIKHPNFPTDGIDMVFNDMETSNVSDVSLESSGHHSLSLGDRKPNGFTPSTFSSNHVSVSSSAYERAVGQLIAKMEALVNNNQLANEQVTSLQQTISMMRATDCKQSDILYKTQAQNEKYKKQIVRMNEQLEDAQNTLRVLKGKLDRERIDRDKQIDTMTQKIQQQTNNYREEVETLTCRLQELDKKFTTLQQKSNSVQVKLEEQTNKNNDLAGVLVKFEERVKQKDMKLEESKSIETALRKDLEQREQSVKHLEKTLLERENRLRQATSQLEEMKRVQEMVAKLMGSNAGRS